MATTFVIIVIQYKNLHSSLKILQKNSVQKSLCKSFFLNKNSVCLKILQQIAQTKNCHGHVSIDCSFFGGESHSDI